MFVLVSATMLKYSINIKYFFGVNFNFMNNSIVQTNFQSENGLVTCINPGGEVLRSAHEIVNAPNALERCQTIFGNQVLQSDTLAA